MIPTAESLESLVAAAPDPRRRATAYAALTLTRILAPEWRHVIRVKDATPITVDKPAGETVGDRAGLEERLAVLLDELTCGESH